MQLLLAKNVLFVFLEAFFERVQSICKKVVLIP